MISTFYAKFNYNDDSDLMSRTIRSRVSNPYSFDTDPDPAVWAEYRSGSETLIRSKATK
jgi:hypothetical protein